MASQQSEAKSVRGSVLGWVVPLLAAYVREQGYDCAPILQLPGIRGRDLKDPDIRVPEAASREAWRLAMAITADDAIGLHVAQWLPRGALDLIEYSFRASSTLGDGLDRLARYGRLVNDRLAVHVLRSGPGVRFLLGVSDARPLHPQRAEFSVALALRLARDATATHLIPAEVVFVHAPPGDTTGHRLFFGSPAEPYGAGASIPMHEPRPRIVGDPVACTEISSSAKRDLLADPGRGREASRRPVSRASAGRRRRRCRVGRVVRCTPRTTGTSTE
jgi:hypothetical protein